MGLIRFFASCLLGFLLALNVSLAQSQDGPDVIIKRAVDEVTAAIKADREIQSGNRHKINALVDNKIVPYVNFQRMTQSAVGRHWSRATPEQQQALTREFKGLLTNTYSGAFSTYRADTVIEYRPLRMQPGDTDAVVRSTVKAGGGEPIQLDYYLEKVEGAWKSNRYQCARCPPGRNLPQPVQLRDRFERHRWLDQGAGCQKPYHRSEKQVVIVQASGILPGPTALVPHWCDLRGPGAITAAVTTFESE